MTRLVLILLLAFPIAAHAVPLLITDGSGQLVGATGVEVNGALFDVTFSLSLSDAGCENPSADGFDCDFGGDSWDPASAAKAQALLDQVFVDSDLGLFDSDPTLTSVCPSWETVEACRFMVPFSLDGGGNLFYYAAVNAFVEADDGVPGGDEPLGLSPSGGIPAFPVITDPVYVEYILRFPHVVAVFSPAVEVPEPSTLFLLGTGLIGLLRRRR